MAVQDIAEISQELFQLLKQFSRLKWEKAPVQDIKPSESDLLGMLYLNLDNGVKTLPASELSNQLNITPAGVTHLLNPLEHGGFIKRQKDPDDRRYVLIELTGKGKKAAETRLLKTCDHLEDLVLHLGEKNSQDFIRLMSSLIDYFESDRAYNQAVKSKN